MTSTKPYLIKALLSWIVDNNLTPHILVDANNPSVSVPREYVGTDGKVVLSIDARAVRDFVVTNDDISFGARFSGKPFQLYTPMSAVLAIFAKENGQGMLFPPDEIGDAEPEVRGSPVREKPKLSIVK